MSEGEDGNKQAFFSYQRNFRRAAADRLEIEQEWSRKTELERQTMAVAMRALAREDVEYKRVVEQLEHLDPQLKWIREELPKPLRDLHQLDNCIAEALPTLRTVHMAIVSLTLAWRELLGLEHEQGQSSNQRSMHHAEDQANEWDQLGDRYEEEIATFERFQKEEQPVPLNANGEARIPLHWLDVNVVDDEDRAKTSWTADRNIHRFGLDEPRSNVTWVPWRETSGGQSEGYLWLCFDDTTGRVVDRAFRKDVFFEGTTAWHALLNFDGDLRDADSKTPWEISCHNAVQDIARFDNVVRLREGKNRDLIDSAMKTIRLYVEWCPNGDLSSVLDKYGVYKETIPEPMLWNILECMSEAAKAMADGHVDDGCEAPDWQQIVHRDLKPRNILLGYPDPARYPQYPRPLLADFGLSFKTRPRDATNPELWAEAGTRGYFAPEQERYVNRATGQVVDTTPLSGATNIYGIGAILSTLMRRPTYLAEPIWMGDGSPGNTLYTYQIPEDVNGTDLDQYSNELKKIVNRCLSFRPEDRPNAEELRRSIQDAVWESERPQEDGTAWPDLAKGMRSGKAAKGAGVEARKYAVWFNPDPYQLQFARHQLPRQQK